MDTDPLLIDDGQLTLFPIKYDSVYTRYQEAKSLFWTPEELDFSKDKMDWAKLDDKAKLFLKHVLAFFAASDALVNNNLIENFCREISHQEVKSFYSIQMAIEAIHSETYSLLIDTLITDPKEKDHLFNSIKTMPIIAKKADWIKKWTNDKERGFAERLVAFAAVEGIFFSGSFASIFWIKQRGVLPGLTSSNTLIARDEGLHVKFATTLYSILRNKPDKSIVIEIIKSAVDIEKEFNEEAIPVAMIGINMESMKTYIEFVADQLSIDLIGECIYKSSNPFPFMNNISLECKTNFFERRATEYRKCPINDHNESNGEYITYCDL